MIAVSYMTLATRIRAAGGKFYPEYCTHHPGIAIWKPVPSVPCTDTYYDAVVACKKLTDSADITAHKTIHMLFDENCHEVYLPCQAKFAIIYEAKYRRFTFGKISFTQCIRFKPMYEDITPGHY